MFSISEYVCVASTIVSIYYMMLLFACLFIFLHIVSFDLFSS